MTLSKPHYVVTGGGSGVGAAVAQSLARNGFEVTIMGRTEQALQEQGLAYEVCDVTDRASLARAVSAARARHGPIAGVVANAGAAESAPFAKVAVKELQAMMSVNLIGVFNIWQEALPDMKAAGGGRLMAIASTAGLKGYPYVSAYCAAKHAVVGLTRALAVELARTGITVNAICPGFVDTPMLDRSIRNIVDQTGLTDAAARDRLASVNPQGRFVQTDEIAEAVLWLSSKAAQSVNGHTLVISGGEV